jgi:hypothetical protein
MRALRIFSHYSNEWIVLCTICLGVLLLPGTLAAQDSIPKLEFFGGYSHITEAKNFFEPYAMLQRISSPKQNMNGPNVGMTLNVNKWFGVELFDCARYTRTDNVKDRYLSIGPDSYKHGSFLLGPRFSFRISRFTLFCHFMVGGVSAGYQEDNKSFAGTLFGGGLDVNIIRNVAIRVMQADIQRAGQPAKSNPQISTGIVFLFLHNR